MPEQTVAQWISELSYQNVRSAEELLEATSPTGSRLRGVLLTPDLCLGRDRQFYRMPAQAGERATPVSVADVEAIYSAHQLDDMWRDAVARQRCHHVIPKVAH